MDTAIEFAATGYAIHGRVILGSLDLAVRRGETLVLLGESGAGKSTALRLVNRLVVPTSGDVLVDGRSTGAWNPVRLRRGIGYVIQDVGLLPHLDAERNIGMVPRLEGWPAGRIRDRVTALMELVGLPRAEFGSRFPHQLSGGQRQRIGVARALAADPPVLLLDEPFGALDPKTRSPLQREFRELAGHLGKTVLFVTHDVAEAR
ncbi:MAG: ATP-binding cassette domain-containing protein, partial [Gemmatimonadales bacterium]